MASSGASAIVLLALTIITSRQISYWQDNLTLWSHAVQVVPNHWAAEVNVGLQLQKQGKMAEALPHYRRAISIYPYEAVSNMAVGYDEQTHGNSSSALEHYQHALSDFDLTDGERAQIWRNMGVAYRDLGDPVKAQECFETAARFNSKESIWIAVTQDSGVDQYCDRPSAFEWIRAHPVHTSVREQEFGWIRHVDSLKICHHVMTVVIPFHGHTIRRTRCRR